MNVPDRALPGTNRARSNLKDEVAQYVRDLILSGALVPGRRLDQDDIAARLGTSRLPVREALITLEAEGLVDNLPRRGSFVAPLETQDIEDHYEMYGLLSGIAAERAADSASPDLVAQLQDVCVQMWSTDDPAEHDRLNYVFHLLINRSGSSGRLRAVLRTLSASMPTHFFAHSSEQDWKVRALDEHDAIVAAIAKKDGRSARELMTIHFRNTGEQAVRMLRASGFWATDDPATDG